MTTKIHFETSNSSLAICCIDDKAPVSNYILGVVQDALVPIGEYTHDTRTHIVQEVTMGDKYITSGQVGAVGPGAHAHDLHFDQIWNQSEGEIDIVALTGELSRLREQLRTEAQTPEQDIAVAAVANAEIAARNGDGPKTMEWLNKGGKWAFDVATKIGVGVASAALKSALGI